ncbi:MAG: hypothetical protein JW881_17685 [Spirochaetales bacterium]|nr:hypothetical protein [Spirochaetales bacterium]
MESTKTKKAPDISLAINVKPLSSLSYGASSLLGDINALLAKFFYSQTTAKKVYVTLCELVSNVVDYIRFPGSSLKVELKFSGEDTIIKVKNKVDKDRFESVKAHIDSIRESGDPVTYFSETISKKRKEGVTHGLGLLRLFIESSPRISATFNDKTSYMTIETKLDTRSLLC